LARHDGPRKQIRDIHVVLTEPGYAEVFEGKDIGEGRQLGRVQRVSGHPTPLYHVFNARGEEIGQRSRHEHAARLCAKDAGILPKFMVDVTLYKKYGEGYDKVSSRSTSRRCN